MSSEIDLSPTGVMTLLGDVDRLNQQLTTLRTQVESLSRERREFEEQLHHALNKLATWKHMLGSDSIVEAAGKLHAYQSGVVEAVKALEPLTMPDHDLKVIRICNEVIATLRPLVTPKEVGK